MINRIQRVPVKMRLLFNADVSSLFQGAGLVLLVNAFGQLIVFFVQAALARIMGVEEYGVYSYVYSWLNILLIFSLVGFDTAVVRFLPAYRANEEWQKAHGMFVFSRWAVFGTSLVVALTAAIIIYFLEVSLPLKNTFWAACIILPIWAQFRVYHGILQALNAVVYSQLLLTIVRPLIFIVLMLTGFYFFSSTVNSVQAIWLHIISMLLLLIISWRIVRALAPQQLLNSHSNFRIREWMRVSLPLSFVYGMRLLLNSTDIILVGILLGTAEAGIYTVASRIAQLMLFGNSASNAVMAPLISELFEKQEFGRLQQTVTAACWFSVGTALLIGGIIFVGSNILLGFYGEGFLDGKSVLLILGATQILNAGTGPVGHLLNMTGHQDVNSKMLAVTAILNLILNYPAILHWGIAGAAIVTGMVGLLKAIWAWYEVRRRIQINSSIVHTFSQ